MSNENEKHKKVELNSWNPKKILQSYTQNEVKYSRGFLRCSPEKWFPGVSMQWLPLAHSLGVDILSVSAKPFIGKAPDCKYSYVFSLEQDYITVAFENESVQTILEYVLPRATKSAKDVILEYLAIRLVTSLALSWSGAEAASLKYEHDLNANSDTSIGGINLRFSLNGAPVEIWIKLSKPIVERMDGLWCRQLHSTSTFSVNPSIIRIEIANLTVPPSMLSNYLKLGICYDLEVPVSDSVNLVLDDRHILPATLGIVDGKFSAEVVSKNTILQKIPAGTTKLSFELGETSFDFGTLSEICQAGASFNTNIPVSNDIKIVVNGEQVGKGKLYSHQGSLVVKVV